MLKQRLHQTNNNVAEKKKKKKKKPYFCRVIFPGISKDHIKIPRCFFKHIKKDVISDIATLIGPSGTHWHVKACKSGNSMVLQNGWGAFLRDHSLGDHEFLVFRYDGRLCFNVQVFDKSGLERVSFLLNQETASLNKETKRGRHSHDLPISQKSAPGHWPPKKTSTIVEDLNCTRTLTSHMSNGLSEDEHLDLFESDKDQSIGVTDDLFHIKMQEKSALLPNEKRKPGRPRKDSVDSLHHLQLISSQHYPDKRLPHDNGNTHKKTREKNVSAVKIKAEDSELPTQIIKPVLEKAEAKRTGRRIKIEEIDLPANKMDPKAIPTKQDTTLACKSVESFHSTFPHFMKLLAHYNVGKPYIFIVPTSFAKTHLPCSRSKMILWNSKRRAWEVNYVPGTRIFGGGWIAFVGDNKLQAGDICIFELVKEKEMMVHIIRSSSR